MIGGGNLEFEAEVSRLRETQGREKGLGFFPRGFRLTGKEKGWRVGYEWLYCKEGGSLFVLFSVGRVCGITDKKEKILKKSFTNTIPFDILILDRSLIIEFHFWAVFPAGSMGIPAL